MTVLELKQNIHKAIDRLEDKELLQIIYDILIQRENTKPGNLYNSLTKEQKVELLKSYEESEDGDNLISNDDVFMSLNVDIEESEKQTKEGYVFSQKEVEIKSKEWLKK